MDLKKFLIAYDALKDAQTSDEPGTKRDAKALATALTDGIGDLSEWATDFESAVADLIQKAEDLAEADRDDRIDCHGELVAAAETVVDSLVDLGINPDTIDTLRATAA